jgi:hypothetical protein
MISSVGTAIGDGNPVAVAPYVVCEPINPHIVEIGCAVRGSRGVGLKAAGHRRHRLAYHHLAHLVDQRLAVRRPGLQVDPKKAARYLWD